MSRTVDRPRAASYHPPVVQPPKCCGSCERFALTDHPGRHRIDAEGRPYWRGRCQCWELAGRKHAQVTTLNGTRCEAYRWVQARAR